MRNDDHSVISRSRELGPTRHCLPNPQFLLTTRHEISSYLVRSGRSTVWLRYGWTELCESCGLIDDAMIASGNLFNGVAAELVRKGIVIVCR